MTEPLKLPNGAQPDPDHDGWYSWGDFPRGSFAAQTGRLLFKPTGPNTAQTRMFPEEMHNNMGGSIHGGAVMSFIDMSMFAGGRCAGMAEGHYVTLDCTTKFIQRGEIGVPLDAFVTLRRQTGSGIVFLDGYCEQNGVVKYSFTGTLKRISPRKASTNGDDDRTRN